MVLILATNQPKGQFECGALRCNERRDLHSYELNFKYKEAGSVKNELVKVRCIHCPSRAFFVLSSKLTLGFVVSSGMGEEKRGGKLGSFCFL